MKTIKLSDDDIRTLRIALHREEIRLNNSIMSPYQHVDIKQAVKLKVGQISSLTDKLLELLDD